MTPILVTAVLPSLLTIMLVLVFFFFNDTATTEIYTLSLHDALPISRMRHGRAISRHDGSFRRFNMPKGCDNAPRRSLRSEEHTSELQSQSNLVCRLLLEKKKNTRTRVISSI